MYYFLFESAKIGIFCVIMNIFKQKVSELSIFMRQIKILLQILRRIGRNLLLLSQISLNENRAKYFL